MLHIRKPTLMQIIQSIQNRICEYRGESFKLTWELAKLYEIEARVLNQAVKCNLKRFPKHFMCQLTEEERESLRFQLLPLEEKSLISPMVILKAQGGNRHLSHDFTKYELATLRVL